MRVSGLFDIWSRFSIGNLLTSTMTNTIAISVALNPVTAAVSLKMTSEVGISQGYKGKKKLPPKIALWKLKEDKKNNFKRSPKK